MREVDIGPVENFTTLPAEFTVEGKRYFLVRSEEHWVALSAVCPHKGGDVVDQGDVFSCPQHGWTFDKQSGRCLNVSRAALEPIPVQNQDGRLVFQMRHEQAPATPSRRIRKGDFSLSLHAHACFQIDHNGFSLLTDPWLDGPAFMGAWTQYPPPLVRPE